MAAEDQELVQQVLRSLDRTTEIQTQLSDNLEKIATLRNLGDKEIEARVEELTRAMDESLSAVERMGDLMHRLTESLAGALGNIFERLRALEKGHQ